MSQRGIKAKRQKKVASEREAEPKEGDGGVEKEREVMKDSGRDR